MTPTTPFTFQLGDPVEHRGIVITPLFPARDPVAAYITLDEALPRGLTITEISDAGSVPELAVINPLDETVLLYDGEELVGAKQNRILNVSVLVGAGAKLPIPVSCVEQGRWNRSLGRLRRGDRTSRTRTCDAARPRCSLRSRWPAASRRTRCGARSARSRSGCRVASPTGANRDTFEAYGDRLRQARGRVPARARPVRRRARDRRRAVPRHRVSAGGVHRALAEAASRLPARRARAARPATRRHRADRRLRRRGRRRACHPRRRRPGSARTCACAAPA